jgi:hypothetical protein
LYLFQFSGPGTTKEPVSQAHHDIPATVEKHSRTAASSHNTTPPVSSPSINQIAGTSNGGSSNIHRPPSAPMHHPAVSSNSSIIPSVPSERQSSLASLLGMFLNQIKKHS